MIGAEGTLSCDVFIAGSGLAGCTFARLLGEAGASIIMADAGDQHSRLPGENRKNGWLNQRELIQYGHFVRSQLHPLSGSPDYPAAMTCYAVGGMAVHWTCAIPEFHPTLELPDFIPAYDWRRHYNRAAALLNRHDDVFSTSARHRATQSALQARGWSVKDTPMAGERVGTSPFVHYTGADTLLGPLAHITDPRHFRILPEQIVQRLVPRPGKSHDIDHAELRNARTGAISKVQAKLFVITLGWLHNAQLLFASGIPAHDNSALGRYFSDHSFANSTIILDDPVMAAAKALGRLDDDGAPHLYLPVADGRPWQGMIFRESYQFEPDEQRAADPRGIDLKWFGMIEPQRENRVLFDSARCDRIGMPVADFRLRLSADDLLRQQRMVEDMRAVAGCLGAFRPGGEPALAPLGSAIHATGLTRMGADDDGGRTSVVDSGSKVWGMDNLFVGGTSVIPTASAANPTFTAIALAVRAAEKLASDPH